MPTLLLIVIVGLPLVALIGGLIYTVVHEARNGDFLGVYILAGIALTVGWLVALVHLVDRIAPLAAS